jgi:Peptidase family M50.
LKQKGGGHIFTYEHICIKSTFLWIERSICLILSGVLIYGFYDSKTIFEKILLLNIDATDGVEGLLFFILGVILYYFSIFIHEAGHYIVLKALRYKLKLFVIGPIIYIKNNKSYKLKRNRSGLLLFGGCVMPEINDIICDELSLNKCVKQYIKLLYGGIWGTIALIVSSSIFILINKYTVINLIILIINWAILINSFSNDNLVFGDYCLIELLKSRPYYLVAFFQNNLATEYPLNSFVKTKMDNFLERILLKREYNELILSLIDKILDDYIIEQKMLTEELERFKNWVFDNYGQFNKVNKSLIISIIKSSYKFLLHEHSIGMSREFLCNYKKFENYLSNNENFKRYEYIKRMINTLQVLEKNEGFLELDSKYPISDLEDLLKDCDNYNKKIILIISKLNRRLI